jgi:hypothetical protein
MKRRADHGHGDGCEHTGNGHHSTGNGRMIPLSVTGDGKYS